MKLNLEDTRALAATVNSGGGYTEIRDDVKAMEQRYGFDLEPFKNKTEIRKVLRNCVAPEVGKYIFESIIGKP